MPRLLLWFSGAFFLIGCHDNPPTTSGLPSVAFVTKDARLTGPDQIASGLVRVVLRNQGSEVYRAVVAALLDSTKGLADVVDWYATWRNGHPDWLRMQGGVGPTRPGDSTVAISHLEPGRFIVGSFPPSIEDPGHPRQAMAYALTVIPSSVEPVAPPLTDAILELNEYALAFLPQPGPGQRTIRVINTGEKVHDLLFARLDGDAGVEQLLAGLAPGSTSPIPGRLLNSIGALSPGQEGWITVDLTPGRYVMLCLEQDADDGASHYIHGMLHTFRIP